VEICNKNIEEYSEFAEHIVDFLNEDFYDDFSKICNLSGCSHTEWIDSLFISGGATRFVGLGAAAIRLLQLGYNPKVIGGISAGAVLALPLVLGKYDQIIEYGSKATRKNIFKIAPVGKKGNISTMAVLMSLFGCHSFGVQDIKPLIREVVSKEDFKRYQDSDSAEVYIMAVNGRTGGRKLWNIKSKDYNFEDYLQFVSASSRIPIMTQAEIIDGQPYFDGGIRNHIPTLKVLKEVKNIGKIASIYARPQIFKEVDDKVTDNIMTVINRTIRIMSMEISRRDQSMEKLISKLFDIKLKQFFLPNILESLYDTSPENLLKLKNAGIASVENNIGNFLQL
jgi:predicted acylesterase/phospholipase RssA